jgi:NADH dehydrogenase
MADIYRDRIVTVFGGSGFIGRHLVRRLAKRGFRIRAAVRSPNLAHFLQPMGDVGQIQLTAANVTDPDSVNLALNGASDVINLVGILSESWSRSFEAIHVEGAATVARAARDAGVKSLVHMSALGADTNSPSLYARSKASGEATVREIFSGATIIRPSIVFGPEDSFFNRFANMARYAGVMPLIGSGATRYQPVFVGDVAEAIARIIEDRALAGKVYELGGPNIYTFRELIEFILRTIERKRFLADIPFPLASAIGTVAQYLPGKVLTADQVHLLKSDNVVSSGAAGFADLGITPASPEAIVPQYLVRFRKTGEFEPVR